MLSLFAKSDKIHSKYQTHVDITSISMRHSFCRFTDVKETEEIRTMKQTSDIVVVVLFRNLKFYMKKHYARKVFSTNTLFEPSMCLNYHESLELLLLLLDELLWELLSSGRLQWSRLSGLLMHFSNSLNGGHLQGGTHSWLQSS